MTALTSKGRVTIPKPVRDLLGLVPGQQVVFDRAQDGSVVVRKAADRRAVAPPKDRFTRVRGSADAGLSTDEIMALMRGAD